MSHPRDEEIDRVVSRRVEDRSSVQEGDEQVYAAAATDPDPGPTTGAPAGPDGGGTAERAAAEPAGDEPTRSE